MYTEWFKLRKLPFRLRPDPEFLYLDSEAGPVLESLRAAVGSGHGALCLLGESGVGKTTLLHALAREKQGSMPVVRLQQPGLTAGELRDALADQFGLPPRAAGAPEDAAGDGASDGDQPLAQFIAAEAAQGRGVLILVDEAHRFALATLRELLKIGTARPAPLIVLAGETELSRMLATLEGQGSFVGLIGSLRVPRLNETQIAGYVAYRLKIAGSNGREIFEADTMPEILRYTGGTPQLINMLCDSAMNFAEAHSQQRVGSTEIRDAVQELRWVEFAARPARSPAGGDAGASGSSRQLAQAVNPELEVQQSGRHVGRLALRPGRLVVGRAEDAGLRLESRFVSRQHCQLITTADQTFVEDLGSTNGILVNGCRRRLHRLVPEDKIVIGDHTLIYYETPRTGAN